MKKTIASLALAAITMGGFHAHAQVPMLEDVSLGMTQSFESEYIFRGFQEGRRVYQSSVDAALPMGAGTLYTEAWGSFPVQGAAQGWNELNLIAGYSVPVELVNIDVGFTYYWFPERGFIADRNREKEVYVGVGFDTILNPEIYVFHNFSIDAWIVEASIGHNYPLDEVLSLDLRAKAGTAKASDMNSDQSPGKPSESWNYYQLSADLVYALNEITTLSVGGRFAKIQGEPADYTPSTDQLWWGGSISMAF